MARNDTALLVDREPATQEAIRQYLSPFCDVVCATTSRQGREILRKHPVAVVLLEAHLPDRPGLEFFAEIRQASPRLPVIMVTGFGSESLCAEAFRMGVNDYFPKPINPVALTRSVRALLDVPELRVPAQRPAHTPVTAYDATTPGLHLALRYLHEHYCEKVSLGDVAGAARASYFTTSRMFTARLGVSFQTYLHQLRVEQAKRLLTHTECTVATIGPMVGFGDLSRFNKTFRKCAGMTPTEYRRLGRAKVADKKSITA